MIFNERLKMLREEHGLTQEKAAGALGIPLRSYNRLEADGSKTHYDTLLKIADYYDVSVDWLMGRTAAREVNRQVDHRVITDAEVEVPEALERRVSEVVSAALRAEGVEVPCEVDVLFTDDAGIHTVNLEMRGVDRPTDVLSFPMFSLAPGDKPTAEDADPETGLVPLGDMCISLERAEEQASEYGHSVEREVCYLAVHSVLHLLGYDHMDEGPMKRQMRAREEAILESLGIGR